MCKRVQELERDLDLQGKELSSRVGELQQQQRHTQQAEAEAQTNAQTVARLQAELSTTCTQSKSVESELRIRIQELESQFKICTQELEAQVM